MAPKKATGAAAESKTKKAAPSGTPKQSFNEMIKEAIITLKDRQGSSRQAIKKYILSNKGHTDDKLFNSQLNRAIRAGVEKDDFEQPKGASGPVKLARKEAAAKKTSPPKDTTAKKESKPKTETKKASTSTTTKKTSTTKPAASKKAATTTKKTAAAKPAKAKANTSSKRKTAPVADAVVDVPKTLSKTKSGRVTKTTATPATKKAPAKKAAAKKAAPKKKAEETKA